VELRKGVCEVGREPSLRHAGGASRLAPTASSTTTVEIDTALLERLRERSPGKSDRAVKAVHEVRRELAERQRG
jgi:hypothetical protein